MPRLALGADLAYDEPLERLAVEDEDSAVVARLRLFTGLTVEESAEALGLSRATAFREWAYAKAWLTTALHELNQHTSSKS